MPSSVARKAKTGRSKRMLRLPEVIGRTGRSKAGIYILIREGKFPAPKRIGKRAVAWEEDAVDGWVGGLPTCQYAPLPSPEPAALTTPAAVTTSTSASSTSKAKLPKSVAKGKAKPPNRSAPPKAAAIATPA